MMRYSCIGLVVWLAAMSAGALEVKEVRWGFGGRVVPERFNLVSVRVGNLSSAPFDGMLRLTKTEGLDQEVGAPFSVPCYVSPGQERWVQFLPYIAGQSQSQWRLSWGRRASESAELQSPDFGPPACVVLRDSFAVSDGRSAWPVFPDQLMPTSVAGMDGVDSFLLDHVPDWEPVRRIALLDWLRGGGVLHLLRGSGGAYPQFSGELAVLNDSGVKVSFGAGWIVRHPRTSREIGVADLEAAGFAAPRLEAGHRVRIWQMADAIFPMLTKFTRPRHAWWLINTLTFCYIVLIGPGVFYLARRTRNHRLALLAMVGCVAVFCGLLGFIGRRGWRDQGAVHSFACARALGDGQYQVTQWISVFASRGAAYELTHAATHNYYAVGQDRERVNGTIIGGKDGRFLLDMPFCSHRGVVHQARMEGPVLGIQVATAPRGDDLDGTVLSVGSGFPVSPVGIWAVYRDRVWPMRLQDGRLLVPDGAGVSVTNWLADFQGWQAGGFEDPAEADSKKREAFQRLAPAVVGWALGGTPHLAHYVVRVRRDDRLRLFVMAGSPERFRLRGTPVGAETGYVIYDTDVMLDSKQGARHD